MTAPIDRLRAWPRLRLANLPTPLRNVPRLSAELGGTPMYVKMDAETGFALGGNKVRKLELVLASDRIEGVTHLVTAGGPQSNHCRVTAAAAARLGLSCVLVTQAPAPDEPTGNALLHRLFGAEIVTVEDRSLRTRAMDEVAERIRDDGGHPAIIPIGASTGLGSLGYALAAAELCDQLDALDDGCRRTVLFTSSSSGGTLAGLILGMAMLDRPDVRLVAVSADAPAGELRETALHLATEGAALLDARPDVDRISLDVDDTQVGAGYGIPTRASTEALRLFARLEGIVLDPTYTAKAAAGMTAALTEAPPEHRTRTVFLHTGGAPGLLA